MKSRPLFSRRVFLALALLVTTFSVIGLVSPSSVASAAAETRYQVIVENGVRIKMRDGVSLVADIYRPKSEEKFPVLLERTPYDRKGDSDMAYELSSHGYVVVLQDTRGRYASGGEFYPFRDESTDGFDTVEWAVQLNYADGKVGMFGGSYVGATQMLAAMAQPPHLVAIFPYVTSSEYYEGWTYQGGALMEWFVTSWSSGLAVDTLRRKTAALSHPHDWVEAMPMESYRLLDLPPVADLAPYLRDWMHHETRDAYWKATRVSDH